MSNDNIRFNEKLKFSWGHIIAAVALVAVAYCTFVGMVYLLKGQFLLSGIITAVVTLMIAAIFFIPQQLKATDRRFERRLKWERAFIFSSPVLFLLLMVPFSHAWTVHHRQSLILDDFNQIISSADEMFDQYELYSKNREISYGQKLGVGDGEISIENSNKLEILHLALLSQNYDSLKSVSKAWMEKSVNGDISTWNVFLLGNLTGIQEAIFSWHDDLQMFSSTKLSDEGDVKQFDSSQRIYFEMENNIANTAAHYTDIKGFNPLTPLWLLIVYAMLLFPYLLQSRHTKTTGTNLTLFGFRNNRKGADNTIPSEIPDNPHKTDETRTENLSEQASGQKPGHDSFESFKM